MNKNHFYFFSGAEPLLNNDGSRERSFVRPDSILRSEWVGVRYVPDRAESQGCAVEVVSLLESHLRLVDDRVPSDQQVRLRALMAGLMPTLLDYRTALLEVDAAWRSEGDRRANAERSFRVSWHGQRLVDAFEALKNLPTAAIAQAGERFRAQEPADRVLAIARNGHILKLFSPEAITPEMTLRAVQCTPAALQQVPGHLRTRALCEAALAAEAAEASSNISSDILQYCPPGMRDAALCRLAVQGAGLNLQHVPPEVMTAELCATACLRYGLAYEFVPKALRQPEVEFCTALHGYHTLSPDAAYQRMVAADPQGATGTADRYEALFMHMHYWGASAEDLADLGLRVPAA